MNNKGQILIIFVIMLPILLIILSIAIDLGLLYVDKRNMDNNLKDAVIYYLNHKEDYLIEENTKTLLNKNIKNLDNIEINDNEFYVEITITKKRNSFTSLFLRKDDIVVTYKGLKTTNEVIKG